MDRVKELEEELQELKNKRTKEQKIAQLKKEIANEKFNQTKVGKFFNKTGKFLDDQGKKLEEVDQKPKKKEDLNDLIKKMPR